MKKHYRNHWYFSSILLLLLMTLFSQRLHSQAMNGNFTINRLGSATATNYTSIQAFATDIVRRGVNGAVRVEIVRGSGPYTEQVTLSRVSGVNSSRRIEIDGNGEILQFAPNTTNRFILRFDGGNFYHLKNLVIVGTDANFGWGIHMWRQADDNIIENVRIDLSRVTTTTANNSVGIAIINSDQTVGQVAGTNGYRNIIRDCHIHGGASGGPVYGINVCGTSGQLSENQFINNRIEDFFSYGFYTNSIGGTIIRGNIISRPTRTATTTIYGFYCINANNPDNIIEDNITTNIFGGNPNATNVFYAWSWATPNTPAGRPWICRNNIIANVGGRGTVYGFSSNFIQNAQFLHNTISIDDRPASASTSQLFAFDIRGPISSAANLIELKNNIVSITRPTSGICRGFFTNNTTNPDRYHLEHNVYHVIGSTSLNYIADEATFGQHTSLETWQTASKQDLKSIVADPVYADLPRLNMAIRNAALNDLGDFLTAAPRDIFGIARKRSGVDPGAVEVPLDAEIVSASIPNQPYCSGDKPEVTVTVRNFGEFDLMGTVFQVNINNGAITYLDTVGTTVRMNRTETFKLTKTLPLQSGAVNDVRINFAVSDDNPRNDTVRFQTPFVGLGPTGGELTTNSNSFGLPPTSDREYWITNPEEPLIFNLSRPTNFSNSDFGTKYTITSRAVTLAGRKALPSSAAVYSHNPTTGGTWTIRPPDAFIDSLVEISLQIIDVQSNCDTTIRRQVLIVPAGKPGFRPPSSICVGNSIEIENESIIESGYMLYEWDFGNGVVSDKTNGIVTYSTPGTYQVRLRTTSVPYGYVREVTKNVTVSDGPIASFEAESGCFGTAVILRNTTQFNGTPNYLWDFGNGQSSILANPTVNYTSPGVYTVRLRAERNGCATEASLEVGQFEKPVPDFNISNNNCQNSAVRFENLTGNVFGKVGYLWSFGEDNVRSTQVEGLHTYKTFGNKTVKLVVRTALGCDDSISKNITIIPGPSGEFSITGECQNNDITFEPLDQAIGQNMTFSWIIHGEAISQRTPVRSYSSIGVRNASLTVRYQNGCANTVSREFMVKSKPVAQFSHDRICSGQEFAFDNQTVWSDGAIRYTWNLGGGITTNQRHPLHVYTVTNDTDIEVELTAEIEDGCSDVIRKNVRVNSSPKKCEFEAITDFAQGFRFMRFVPTDGQQSGPENGVTYTWFYGDGTDEVTTTGSKDYSRDGAYRVAMRAERDNGCFCESSQSIVIDRLHVEQAQAPLFNVYPNPNKGRFKIEIDPLMHLGKIAVFDALGKEIYSSSVSDVLSNSGEIHLQMISAGLYIVKLSGQEAMYYRKIQVLE
jgi:PKD repeat protein